MSGPQNAVCAIMAGGSGTRFWPLSRLARPKQMLALAGEGRTLLRATYERVSRFFPPERILVVTARRLAAAVAREIPELPAANVLGEPVPRSTAPCIAWAVARTLREHGDAPIVAVPADHWIDGDEAYAQAMQTGVDLAREGWIATFGVPPDHPETGYGYLRAGRSLHGTAFAVEAFIEKPDRERAEQLAEEPGVFWNSGMFVFSAGRMMAELEARLPISAAFAREIVRSPGRRERAIVRQRFPECEATSIDYGIMERADRVAVVVAGFAWSDIGSWDAAAKLSEQGGGSPNDAPRVAVVTAGARRTYVRSESKKRRVVAVVGADDLIVVETDDALLVCRRGASQDVRAVVEALRKRALDDLL